MGEDEKWMKAALEEAAQAAAEGEIPVGAVLVRGGQVIAAAHNLREQTQDPTAHAEMLCLRAAAEKLGADYQVLIVGDGPVHDQLEEYITSAGIQDHVKLLGYLEDNEMYSLLAACDVFVLSSVMKTEAFGIVQIEAMSLGKPVIATKIPESGVSWVNADGLSGLNVPIKDAEALAGAVRTVCSDQELHDKLSAGAARRFRDTFTIDQMIDRTIKIYNDEKCM